MKHVRVRAALTASIPALASALLLSSCSLVGSGEEPRATESPAPSDGTGESAETGGPVAQQKLTEASAAIARLVRS